MNKIYLKGSTSNYEYVNALVRAQIGNLFRLREYNAILGCVRLSDITQVLSRTAYNQLIIENYPEDFSTYKGMLTSVGCRNAERLISSSPTSSRFILEEYKALLESQSLVNAWGSQIGRNDPFTNAGIIPLGAFPSKYYAGKSGIGEHDKTVEDFEIRDLIAESLELARNLRSTAPLFRIVTKCSKRLLSKVASSPSRERLPMIRFAESFLDSANIEIILACTLSNIDHRTALSWLEDGGTFKKAFVESAIELRNMTDLLALLRRSRYGNELEACSYESIGHILSKFPYMVMMQEALSALAGYPFRAATVASGMTLKLLEIRNLRLAISAVSGELSRNSALEAMVIY